LYYMSAVVRVSSSEQSTADQAAGEHDTTHRRFFTSDCMHDVGSVDDVDDMD